MLIQFSSVDYIRALKKAKFTDEQAELIAKETELIVANIKEHSNHFSRLEAREPATKGDVRESELGLQKEIKESELRLQKEIKALEVKLMTIYGGGFLILLGVLAKGFHWF